MPILHKCDDGVDEDVEIKIQCGLKYCGFCGAKYDTHSPQSKPEYKNPKFPNSGDDSRIYMIVAMHFKHHINPDRRSIDRSRTWGWYSNLAEAEHAVLINELDIHERLYEYVVIEECYEGLVIGWYECEKHWFHWNDELEKYEKCEEPETEKSIIGYWS